MKALKFQRNLRLEGECFFGATRQKTQQLLLLRMEKQACKFAKLIASAHAQFLFCAPKNSLQKTKNATSWALPKRKTHQKISVRKMKKCNLKKLQKMKKGAQFFWNEKKKWNKNFYCRMNASASGVCLRAVPIFCSSNQERGVANDWIYYTNAFRACSNCNNSRVFAWGLERIQIAIRREGEKEKAAAIATAKFQSGTARLTFSHGLCWCL